MATLYGRLGTGCEPSTSTGCWPYYSLLSQVLRELQFNLRSHSTFHHSTQPTSWVAETMRDEDSFEVVEAWKGNLSVGDRLVIPELRPAANALPNPAHPLSWTSGAVWETIPKQSPGSRMILFLRSKAPGICRMQMALRRGGDPSRTAAFGHIELDDGFCICGCTNNELYYLIRESNAVHRASFTRPNTRRRLCEIAFRKLSKISGTWLWCSLHRTAASGAGRHSSPSFVRSFSLYSNLPSNN